MEKGKQNLIEAYEHASSKKQLCFKVLLNIINSYIIALLDYDYIFIDLYYIFFMKII